MVVQMVWISMDLRYIIRVSLAFIAAFISVKWLFTY